MDGNIKHGLVPPFMAGKAVFFVSMIERNIFTTRSQASRPCHQPWFGPTDEFISPRSGCDRPSDSRDGRFSRNPNRNRTAIDFEFPPSITVDGDGVTPVAGKVIEHFSGVLFANVHPFASSRPIGDQCGQSGSWFFSDPFPCPPDDVGVIKIIMLRSVSIIPARDEERIDFAFQRRNVILWNAIIVTIKDARVSFLSS